MRNPSRGISAIEVLMASAITAVIAVAAYVVIVRMNSQIFLSTMRMALSEEAANLLHEVEIAWRYRTKPDLTAVTYLPGTPFTATTPTPCAGGVRILQTDVAGGPQRIVTFQTVCAPDATSAKDIERAHPDLNCPSGISRVVVTRNKGGPAIETFPKKAGDGGAAICFRQSGDGVSVEVGIMTVYHGETRAAVERTFLSSFDKPVGFEFIR